MDHRSIEAYINGIMIKNLRIEAGYSLKEVSDRSKIEMDALIEIEQGRSMAGMEQVLAVYDIDSDCYHEWEYINHEVLHHFEFASFH